VLSVTELVAARALRRGTVRRENGSHARVVHRGAARHSPTPPAPSRGPGAGGFGGRGSWRKSQILGNGDPWFVFCDSDENTSYLFFQCPIVKVCMLAILMQIRNHVLDGVSNLAPS
jgi:hypothetical protein